MEATNSNKTDVCNNKVVIKIAFGLLSLNTIVMWIFSSAITPSHNWVCLKCRANEHPSMGQQFLFYSVWSFWLTFLVFVTWVLLGHHKDKDAPSSYFSKLEKVHKIAFQLALPHVTTVMVTYIYYVLANPIETFLDMDACYHLWRANLGKTFTDDTILINLYLVLMNIQDCTVHYLSAPFLLYLWGKGEAQFQASSPKWLFPWSTLFVFCLSTVMAIAQLFGGVTLYCGGMWFILCLFTVINLLFHIIFAGIGRFMAGQKQTVDRTNEDTDDIEASSSEAQRGEMKHQR